jgi:hypothetical protein
MVSIVPMAAVQRDFECGAPRRDTRSNRKDQESRCRPARRRGKRDALYSRLAALAKEVDQSKTFFGTLMGLILETSGTLGEAAERLDPLARLIRRLTSVVADQKTADAQSQLPAPPERKRIEVSGFGRASRAQLTKGNADFKSLGLGGFGSRR